MIRIAKNTIDDVLSWNKLLVGINSSAIGALFFKLTSLENNIIHLSVNIATNSFLLSLFSLLIFHTVLINHRNNNNNDVLPLIYSFVFIIGWVSLIIGFCSLVWPFTI
ncbi:hypothetical protein [Halarcobacter ebronensis]|uniref:Uncharacterized protein n=1 Tax=Halarcobacter ebronensis TaxID=1462615 RepID=A0A4V1M0C4_9BACT|nr:hypothetical protein [Halarcobacter ebronensis]QKF81710.1 hypothetical protein AEBR_1216 [Halarcobacter ebronensis]RXK04612.1 hypothetical protein CRV07_10680 [Halarcobacter ebronensis]